MFELNRPFTRNLAVVIGINDYEYVTQLGTAFNDAKKLAGILRSQPEPHNYEIVPLEEAQPGLTSLKTLLNDTLPNVITEQDRLLFYFAGHGYPADSVEGPAGYLVPRDAKPGEMASFLSMEYLHNALSKLDCRHLLIILDCCFAGSFRWAVTRHIAAPTVMYKERFQRYTQNNAWQVITSAAADQKAFDILFDNRVKRVKEDVEHLKEDVEHSPFAEELFEALEKGTADVNGDGIVTATELYLHLSETLRARTLGLRQQQVPGLWPLRKHDKGEFIFILNKDFNPENLDNAPPIDPENNPYRGLESFEAKQSDLFFGRDELIKELYERITLRDTKTESDRPFTVVLGISGSGKSSLVKAGLIPYLDKEEAGLWKILEPMRPGTTPFLALAKAILPISNNFESNQDSIEYLSQLLHNNPAQFSQTIAAWHELDQNQAKKLLLVIDQFEELITQTQSSQTQQSQDSAEQKSEWQQFLDVLAIAIQAHAQNIRIVVTLRSDFEPRFLNSALKKYWSIARFPVRAMRADELRQAIEKPAEEKALFFEDPKLVDRLIEEVGQMPGALPLLSFTLSELYNQLIKRSKEGDTNRALILDKEFGDEGGIAGSLSRRANEVYQQIGEAKNLGEAAQQTMRRVMLRMLTLEGGETTRRRVPRSELVYPIEKESKLAEEVVQLLENARLLVAGKLESGDPYIEPAHDFLVRGWDKITIWLGGKQEEVNKPQKQLEAQPQKKQWFSLNLPSIGRNDKPKSRQEKFNLNLQRELTIASNQWNNAQMGISSGQNRQAPREDELEAKGKNKKADERQPKKAVDWLWDDDPRLPLAEQISRSSDNWLNELEANFVRESILQKRRNISLRWRIAIGVISGLIGLTVFAFIRQQEAERQTALALTSSSESSFRSNQQLDALIASINAGKLLKNRMIPISESTRLKVILTLHQAVYGSSEVNRFEGEQGQRSSILSVRYSPDGKMIASGDSGSSVILWKTDGSIHKKLSFPTQSILGLSFSPDNKEIAAIDREPNVIIWSTLDGKLTKDALSSSTCLGPQLDLGSGSISEKYYVDIWHKLWRKSGETVNTSKAILDKIFSKHEIPVSCFPVKLSPNGSFWVVGVRKLLEIWSTEGSFIRAIGSHSDDITDISFSPDSKMFASASKDNTIKIWKSEDGILLETISKGDDRVRSGHQAAVTAVKFSKDGKLLISLDRDGIGKIWNTDRFLLKETFKWDAPGSEVAPISFSPDGKTFAVGYSSGKIRIWKIDKTPLETYNYYNYKEKCSGFAEPSVIFSPDGKTIVSSGCQNIRILDANGVLKKVIIYQDLGKLHISFSKDSKKFLISNSGYDKSQLYDVDGNLISEVNARGFTTLSPNGNLIAFFENETIQLQNIKGDVVKTYKLKSEVAEKCSGRIKFSSDEQVILLIGSYSACILNVNGESVRVIRPEGRAIIDVSLSSDRKTLAIANFENTVTLFDGNTGLPLKTLVGHTGGVDNVRFSADNSSIITSSSGYNDTKIRFWDLNGSLLNFIDTKTFPAKDPDYFDMGAPLRIDLSPDGQTLVSVSENNMLTFWNLNLDKLLSLGCSQVKSYLDNPNTNLSQEDRQLCQGI